MLRFHKLEFQLFCQKAKFVTDTKLCRVEKIDISLSSNFKGGIESLFDHCVNAMGQWPYCPSHMEVSYYTFGFGAIIWRDLRTLSLLHDSPRNNLYACVI